MGPMKRRNPPTARVPFSDAGRANCEKLSIEQCRRHERPFGRYFVAGRRRNVDRARGRAGLCLLGTACRDPTGAVRGGHYSSDTLGLGRVIDLETIERCWSLLGGHMESAKPQLKLLAGSVFADRHRGRECGQYGAGAILWWRAAGADEARRRMSWHGARICRAQRRGKGACKTLA